MSFLTIIDQVLFYEGICCFSVVLSLLIFEFFQDGLEQGYSDIAHFISFNQSSNLLRNFEFRLVIFKFFFLDFLQQIHLEV